MTCYDVQIQSQKEKKSKNKWNTEYCTSVWTGTQQSICEAIVKQMISVITDNEQLTDYLLVELSTVGNDDLLLGGSAWASDSLNFLDNI